MSNKEITSVLAEVSNNDQKLLQNILEVRQVFSLYLDYKEDTENFNKFIKTKVEEFDKKQSKDKGGT